MTGLHVLFTHQESDILLLQDEITRDIADEIHQILGLSSTPSIHSVMRRPSESVLDQAHARASVGAN